MWNAHASHVFHATLHHQISALTIMLIAELCEAAALAAELRNLRSLQDSSVIVCVIVSSTSNEKCADELYRIPCYKHHAAVA